MRAVAIAAGLAAACGACGGPDRPAADRAVAPVKPPQAGTTTAPRPVSARELETALRRNPNQEATSASCRPARRAERRRLRASFGRTRRPLFVCAVAFRRGGRSRLYDVQVLANGCFVGQSRRGRLGDLGCVRR
jgi:hypothetical protein